MKAKLAHPTNQEVKAHCRKFGHKLITVKAWSMGRKGILVERYCTRAGCSYLDQYIQEKK